MTTIRKIMTATIIGAATLTTGCASIVSDSKWPVAVTSTPDQAQFTIRNQAGVTVAGGTTPQTIMLDGGAGYFDGETYTVHFAKDGYSAGDVIVDSSINGWYFGNLIFGGLAGLFVVDPLTGAMWKLPASAYANLTPNTTAAK